MVVPPDTPATMPVVTPMVATAVLLVVHVPPPVLLSVTGDPMHIVVLPVIADGSGLTVTVVTAVHPVSSV